MIKAKNTYHLALLKHLIVLGFLMCLTVQPVISTIFAHENSNYEWVDYLEKETFEEKEITTDFEDENIEHYLYNVLNLYIEISQTNTCFGKQNLFLNYNFDILLPPPETL